MKKLLALLLALLSALYILNPSAGFLEFLPDNLPFLGNLDEATAVLILIRSLQELGIDLSAILGKAPEKPADARVVEDELPPPGKS